MRRLSIALTIVFTGCASTSPKPAIDGASHLVKARAGEEITWFGDGGDDDAQTQASALLKRDLTVESAVRVALLANRKLQTLYEEIGIAHADLVQAGLLKNPTLAATYDFPLDASRPGFDTSFVTDLVHLFTIGSRKGIARAALEGTKYRVAGEVLRHVYEVKVAYFALQGAQQTFAMRQIVKDSAQAGVELSRRQYEAGTISDLDLANQEALFAQISTEFRRARADVTLAREHLTRLMGVWGSDATWKVSAKLDDLPAREATTEHIESKAIAARYDLAAAHKDVQVVSYALALAKNTRWTGIVDAGVDFHREAEGVRLLGPSVTVQLPLFDQGQATVARIEAQLRQMKNREGALAVDIRSEVRELAARLAVARGIVEDYQRTLVPTRERVVALSQQQYDAMLLGVFQLLVAKQNEINAYREFIEALREYWSLRAELEWKVGGSLERGPAGAHPPSHHLNNGEQKHEHHAP